MNKSTRIVKRLLALFLVVLMSIESFGAVVSDNDGSAFITKAEFDSLKNDFPSQIDQYNTSIDSKLDGAIASYLAGIKVSKDTSYKVEVADWNEVTATNHELPQSYTIPDMNLVFNVTYCAPDMVGEWYEIWSSSAALSYKRPSSITQIRSLVDAGTESTTYTLPDTVVWAGQALNYLDSITASKLGYCDSIYGRPADMHRYDNSYLVGATGAANMAVTNALHLLSGYVPGYAVNNLWTGTVYWYYASSFNFPLYPLSESNWINRDVKTSISLGYIDGKQKKNEHIIAWDNNNWTSLSDPSWANSLGINPTWTENNALHDTSFNKVGRWCVFEISDYNNKGDDAHWVDHSQTYSTGSPPTTAIKYRPNIQPYSAYYSGGYNAESDENIKSVGVLNKTYESAKIYQWKDKRKLARNENISYERINLYNGTLIAYAKQDETFKWEPKITGTYDNSGTDVAITKWRVKLSDKPFGTEDSLGTGGKALKNNGQTNDYLVTNDDGKCKFEFQLGENTTIWCKWWPDDTNICNNYNWKGTLDLTQCGTYTITES